MLIPLCGRSIPAVRRWLLSARDNCSPAPAGSSAEKHGGLRMTDQSNFGIQVQRPYRLRTLRLTAIDLEPMRGSAEGLALSRGGPRRGEGSGAREHPRDYRRFGSPSPPSPGCLGWVTRLRRTTTPQPKTASMRKKQVAETCSWFLPTR